MNKIKSFFRKSFSKSSILFGFTCSFLLGSFVIYAYSIGTRVIFAPGTPISASAVNTNFRQLYDVVSSGLLVESTETAFPIGCTTSYDSGAGYYYCSTNPVDSSANLSSVELNTIVFNEDSNWVSGEYTVVLPGVYKVELMNFSLTYIDSGSPVCTIVASRVKLKIKGIETGLFEKTVFLNPDDKISTYVGFMIESTTSMDNCTGTVDLSDVQFLIRKIL